MVLSIKGRMITAVCVLGLMVSGCSASRGQSEPIDPPPNEAEVIMQQITDSVKIQGLDQEITQAGQAAQSEVYFKDRNGYVVPLSLSVPDASRLARTSLEYMVQDGSSAGMLPPGFTALLPKGTKIKSMDISKDKLATVDFSKEFTHYNVQDERKILEALTWTLTGFPTVDKVKILVEGQVLPEMPEGATPLHAPLTRKMGINLELTPGINPGKTTPVVLYFTASTEDAFTYYVPVTRLIKRTNDAAKAAMEELVKGPEATSGLMTTISAATKVIEVEGMDEKQLVSVDFGSAFLDGTQKASAEALQMVILSLTETTGMKQVQISVNGNETVHLADEESYSMPAARPMHINAYES